MTEAPSPRTILNNLFGRLKKIYQVMFAAVIGLAAITFLFAAGAKPLMVIDQKLIQPFISMLMIISFVDLGIMIFLDRRFKSATSVRNYLGGKGMTAVNVDLSKVLFFDDDKLAISLLPHYFQMCVIRWALILSVGVYGFVIAIVTGTILTPLVFYAVSMAFMLNMKPSMEELQNLLRLAKEARG